MLRRQALRWRDGRLVHRDSTWVPDHLFQGLRAVFLCTDPTAGIARYNHYCSAATMKLSTGQP
ncbi:hypothetical protein PSAC2689_20104 [Paraburkholderia sacchari]